MVLVARQLQEKCREQHKDLFMVFIDLAKAFDTVARPMLWEVLGKMGCPPRYLAVLRSLHDGSNARVVYMGEKSKPFPVDVAVRQGCVLSPVLFNLFLASVTRVAARDVRAEDCVTLSYRLDVACSTLEGPG